MKKFCKLYDHPKLGQVLVKFDRSEGKGTPEVKFYIQPENLGLGVCGVGPVANEDNDESWEAYEKIFNEVTQEKAFAIVEDLYSNLEGLVNKSIKPSDLGLMAEGNPDPDDGDEE